MAWNFVELRDLCVAKHLPDSTVYQDALQWKLKRVELYATLARSLWDDLFSQDEVEFKDEQKMLPEYQAHVESAVQALHSMADILGQIVNLAILVPPLDDAEVYLNSVRDKITGTAPDVALAIRHLTDSDEFKYINGFVNIIKHRRLLNIKQSVAEFGDGKRNDKGFVFEPFTFKGDNYHATWAQDIIGDYKSSILDMIDAVVDKVNAYLRDEQN